MIYNNLKKRIKKNEGYSSCPYKDQLGFLTIGYGHLILPNESYLLQKKINKKILEKVFLDDFNLAVLNFKQFLKSFAQDAKDQELLIEMIFQMGINNVKKFKKLLSSMKKKDKHLVCFEMMNSLWYKQTPNRVKSLIKTFL